VHLVRLPLYYLGANNQHLLFPEHIVGLLLQGLQAYLLYVLGPAQLQDRHTMSEAAVAAWGIKIILQLLRVNLILLLWVHRVLKIMQLKLKAMVAIVGLLVRLQYLAVAVIVHLLGQHTQAAQLPQ
jgi:hypothetical protein